LFMWESSSVRITNTRIVGSHYGIYIQASKDIIIDRVELKEISFSAIFIESSERVLINNTNIVSAGTAVAICYHSNSIKITFSNISCCTYGFSIPDGESITIFLNNFMHNRIYYANLDKASVSFSNGIVGNYWDSYYGIDENGDGVGDTEFIFANNLSDPHPLMHPWQYYLKEDTDGDKLSNLHEWLIGTNPLDNDTDHDGMPDGWEVKYNLNPLENDASEDADGDGLSNLDEYRYGTDPRNPDTDGDGIPDGLEVQWNTNPLDSGSKPPLPMAPGFCILIVIVIVIIISVIFILIKRRK